MAKHNFTEWENRKKESRFDLRLSANQLWLIKKIQQKQKKTIYYKGLPNTTAVIDRALFQLAAKYKIVKEFEDDRYFEK